MKIRDKLLIAFSIYIVVAIFFGLIASRELNTIGKRLTLVETADDIKNNLLEVRRHEKNYLLYKDPANLHELEKYLDDLKENIANIRAEIIHDLKEDNYTMMKQSIGHYELLSREIASNVQSHAEMERIILRKEREMEAAMRGAELEALQDLKHQRKNVMLYKTDEAYEAFSGVLTRHKGNPDIRIYGSLVTRLSQLYRDEKASVDEMHKTARTIESFLDDLSRKERADIAATLKWSSTMLLIALATVVMIGTIVNIKLATSIARPIRRLASSARKVAAGDFSERVDVEGNDELASLETAFNFMEEKLENALWSLEHAVGKLREKQAQLVEAEKIAAVGKLAAGIAHEINNPLTTILTFSSLMLEQMKQDDPHFERVRMIVREARRARNIVRQILSFAREAPFRKETMNVNQPVSEIVESLIAQDAFSGIELVQTYSDGLPDISIDPVRIGQVVLNILLNAVHAITPPGRIKVSTRENGSSIEIVFSDTGHGIPEEHLGRIFDPFFTTKDVDKGTGLGLAVSYGIVKKHGGSIDVSSVGGKGTTFTVRLPIHG